MEIKKSEALFQEAVQYIPGGVNSPVRAFGSIGSTPRFIKKADKALMWDEDGNEYIDFIGSWGPMILGHNHPLVLDAVMEYAKRGLSYGAATSIEVDMAKLICSMVPSIDMVRMVNSGTEAVMSAVRVARGFTRRDKIIKFNGCYHGHSDALLVKAGSGVMTAGVPGSLGADGFTSGGFSGSLFCPPQAVSSSASSKHTVKILRFIPFTSRFLIPRPCQHTQNTRPPLVPAMAEAERRTWIHWSRLSKETSMP